MWILFTTVGLLVLTFGVAYGVGSALPVGHTSTVTVTIGAPPNQVWEAITNYEQFPDWRPEVSQVKPGPTTDGQPSWTEVTKYGELPLQVLVSEPSRRLETKIDGSKLPFGGKWSWTLESEGDKTKVTITENGEVYNPLFRFMSKFIFGHETTLKTYASNLSAKFAKEAK